jgi:hypothetical protein
LLDLLDPKYAHHIIQSRIESLRAVNFQTAAKLPLEELLFQFRHWNNGDPRDTVYSLLALADLGIADITVDYTRSAVAVFVDVVEHSMRSQGHFKIISKPWAPDVPGLPSWIIPSKQSLQVCNDDYDRFYRKQNNPDLDCLNSRAINARIVRPDEQTASTLQPFPTYALIASGITLYDCKQRESGILMLGLDYYFHGFTNQIRSWDAREPDDRLVFLFGCDQALLLRPYNEHFRLVGAWLGVLWDDVRYSTRVAKEFMALYRDAPVEEFTLV